MPAVERPLRSPEVGSHQRAEPGFPSSPRSLKGAVCSTGGPSPEFGRSRGVAATDIPSVITSEEPFRRVATYQNGSPSTLSGPPTSGPWNVGDSWRDQNGAEFVCTAAGNPGTWRQIAPATVSTDPASGTFPTGYLILNVTDGALKHYAGSLSWEIEVGAGVSAKVGFHGATPTAQRANANQAEATDLASVIALANELRVALVEKGGD